MNCVDDGSTLLEQSLRPLGAFELTDMALRESGRLQKAMPHGAEGYVRRLILQSSGYYRIRNQDLLAHESFDKRLHISEVRELPRGPLQPERITRGIRQARIHIQKISDWQMRHKRADLKLDP